jgi:hypothetical protein
MACWRQAKDLYEQLDDPAAEQARAKLDGTPAT